MVWDGNRQTGRTHRMIVAAINTAKKEKTHVVIIAHNNISMRNLQDLYIKLGGDIRDVLFFTNNNCDTGLRGMNIPVFRDHRAVECAERDAWDKLKIANKKNQKLEDKLFNANLLTNSLKSILKEDSYEFISN